MNKAIIITKINADAESIQRIYFNVTEEEALSDFGAGSDSHVIAVEFDKALDIKQAPKGQLVEVKAVS